MSSSSGFCFRAFLHALGVPKAWEQARDAVMKVWRRGGKPWWVWREEYEVCTQCVRDSGTYPWVLIYVKLAHHPCEGDGNRRSVAFHVAGYGASPWRSDDPRIGF